MTMIPLELKPVTCIMTCHYHLQLRVRFLLKCKIVQNWKPISIFRSNFVIAAATARLPSLCGQVGIRCIFSLDPFWLLWGFGEWNTPVGGTSVVPHNVSFRKLNSGVFVLDWLIEVIEPFGCELTSVVVMLSDTVRWRWYVFHRKQKAGLLQRRRRRRKFWIRKWFEH